MPSIVLPKRVLSAALAAGVFSALVAFSATGCIASSSEPTSESDPVAQDDDALSGATAVSRAMQWVNVDLQYCQAAYHQRDFDNACSPICDREEDPRWDRYRSDCSGLVSYAWELPAPGRVTSQFAPENTAVSHVIDGIDLAPGDALNVPSDHIILFKEWVHKGTEAVFIEEPGCSGAIKHAHEFTSNVSISGHSVHVSYEGMTFTAIRHNGQSGGGGTDGCVEGGLYCGGDKVSGSSGTLYRCTGGSSGTVVERCASGCSVNAGSDDSCKAGGGSSGGGGCVHGGLYCGGDKVSGNASTLYRCTSGDDGTVVEHCANGCEVNSGHDDACRSGASQGSGHCVRGGLYCGGDKVTGESNTLYRCTSGDDGTAVQHCGNGCKVNAGSNDSCR